MLPRADDDYARGIIGELQKLPKETEWVEFKENNSDPQEIGEYISALSNSAAINRIETAYMVWGIDDSTHEVVGTTFSPSTERKGNEPLENWLLRNLTPKLDFRFYEVTVDDNPVVLLTIGRAFRHPVRFRGEEYVRVGEVKKSLRDAPDRERALWRVFDETPFERMVALDRVSDEDVVALLDVDNYFQLLELPIPASREEALKAIESDGLISRCDAGGWNITNLGAILFARRLDRFPTLARKALRVVQYSGQDRTAALKEQVGARGYAAGYEGLISYVNALLPSNEVIERALRRSVPMYPELAIRELVANALIHQDFLVTGTGPMIEVFADRIEITNPGIPLIDPERFVDSPPRSRNEMLASLMRRFRICEERGSGVDKVVAEVEAFQLPAPLFEATEGFTRATLFSHKSFRDMTKEERIRACYLHACLCYVTRRTMTNSTLRERFGLTSAEGPTVSKLLNEAVAAGAIVVRDEKVGPKARSYLPYWAAK